MILLLKYTYIVLCLGDGSSVPCYSWTSIQLRMFLPCNCGRKQARYGFNSHNLLCIFFPSLLLHLIVFLLLYLYSCVSYLYPCPPTLTHTVSSPPTPYLSVPPTPPHQCLTPLQTCYFPCTTHTVTHPTPTHIHHHPHPTPSQ